MIRMVNWYVPALHCESCAGRIRRTLDEIDGVQLIRINVARQTIEVEGIGPEALAFAKRQLAQAGYPCTSGELTR